MIIKTDLARQSNRTWARKASHLFGGLCLGLWFAGKVLAAGSVITDINPMRMPAAGDYGLRVISPTLLELTYISTKPQGQTPVTQWNFVGNNSFNPPSASEFAVTVGGQAVPVQSLGFKRRALYAPLNFYDLRIGNYLYLQLASPIADGKAVQVSNPGGNLWGAEMKFSATSDPLRFNPAIHVNQEGYMPDYTKQAMIGYYLGSMGEMPVAASLGFKIIDVKTGAAVYSGSLTPRKDVGYTFSPAPYQQVLQADFTAFKTPGEYRLQVPGLGASLSFMIDPGIAALFTRTYALGLYHQRCGFENDYPYSRFVKGACHSALVSIPDANNAAVNAELANMTADYASSQASGTPRLQNLSSSLYPFVNKGPLDLKGGHHDAGDYSKYTINVAQLIHSLVFAVDAFPGVADLDNLGIPESGDGKSDVLQEAKWEADFLVKMQDADGGFYFLVYPRDREYEADVPLVAPNLGDPQVVFPKTTAATAASVGALAEAGSSPAMKKQFPTQAANYLAAAKKGWAFLQNAFAKYGRDGSYQKITHYGNQFAHNDELAWAAAALYAATGDTAYQSDLMAHFDPSDPNTLEWSWWRLFESYGCAIRTYAFAARTGRLQANQLNADFLAKCEAQITASGDDQVHWAQENAYGNSFADQNKPPRTAGWFFSVNQAFDVATAYQITPKQEYIDTLIGNMNYEAGCNPLNMGFVTGVGWKRQRETVNQYAANDRRVLPPTGIPLGSVQSGFTWLYNYGSELSNLSFPGDYGTPPYAPYDKWGDTFNTTTEFVNPQQGRSLAAVAFLMARTSLKNQAWKSVHGTITGIPAVTPAGETITATLTAPGMDLSQASCVWEGRDQEPTPATKFQFAAVNVGPQWIEVEACLPDGRRVFATTNFTATTATNTPPNSTQSAPLPVAAGMVALYHMDKDAKDATGRQGPLTLSGSAALDPSNVGWMATRAGASLHISDVGDQAVVTIPNSAMVPSGTQEISIEAMIYINGFKAYNRGNVKLVSLNQNWNASLELNENMYYGPRFQCGASIDSGGATATDPLTKNVWHHLHMGISKTGYTISVDGKTIISQPSTDLASWGNNSGVTTLTLGNFDGWIDEVVIRNGSSAQPPAATNQAPSVDLTSPTAGASFSSGAGIVLTAAASDTDGSVSKVEFFQGSTKLGEATSAPFTFNWNNAPAGTFSLTAKATDNAGLTKTSAAISITVKAPTSSTTVSTPVIAPAGGTFTNSVSVSLSCATAGATIYYTIDGSVPSSSSIVYKGPMSLTNSAKLSARAIASGMTQSAVATSTFTVTTKPATGGALPSPWKNADIGSVGLAGNASFANDSYTVAGSGTDIWGPADGFQFVYQPFSGDGEIVARVKSVQATDDWSKAGVMFRETLDPGSRHAMMILSGANWASLQGRVDTGGQSFYVLGPQAPAPSWVKLVRAGALFTSYSSSNGTNWTLVGSNSIPMASNIYVGMAVTAHNNSALNQSVLSNVSVTARTNSTGTLPSPWLTRDIGSVSSLGSATAANGTFTVSGSGLDIWGTADAFRYVYQPWTGDGDIVTRVASVQNTDPWAKGGVMFRETLDLNSANVATVISPINGAAFQWRATTGSYSDYTWGGTVAPPSWAKLSRRGNVFTSYTSTDGTTWNTIGSQTIPMAASLYVGLIVTAHNNAALNTSTFTDVSASASKPTATGLPAPWAHRDVGAASIPGTATGTNGAFTVTASGFDIWSTSDQFQFVHQPWTGDGTLIACVTGLQNTDAWAKAGVMLRETLDPASAHAMTVVSPVSGTAFQRRASTGNYTAYNLGSNLKAPCWLKITRTGSLFTSSVSSDGKTWTLVGSDNVSMGSSCYAGLILSTHSLTATNTATFTNVSITRL